MELIGMIIITLQITATLSKKKHRQHDSEQDESIENLLYYKDCKHKNKELPAPAEMRATEPPPPPPPPQRDPACPCPKMCCSMCCDCTAPESFLSRQMAPLQTAMGPMQVASQPRPPPRMLQPQNIMQQPQMPQMMRANKRKPKMSRQKPDDMLPPIGSRRELGGFTRENIKNLISHDQDIKKILKDLVRVTMTKVDLVEAVNARRNMELHKHTTTAPVAKDEEEDYSDDL